MKCGYVDVYCGYYPTTILKDNNFVIFWETSLSFQTVRSKVVFSIFKTIATLFKTFRSSDLIYINKYNVPQLTTLLVGGFRATGNKQ